MIKAYLDNSCEKLKSSQDLSLSNDFSAIWFRISEEKDEAHFMHLALSLFNSFVSLFWLASSGGSESLKILDFKRAFGAWSIPKTDVLFRNQICAADGQRLFSDIALVNKPNVDLFVRLFNRKLFGIDSAMFFLPRGNQDSLVPSIVNNIEELLIRREASKEISEEINKGQLIESFVNQIISLNGATTLVLQDSNMTKFVVIVGHKSLVNDIWHKTDTNLVEKNDGKIFMEYLNIGISLSILS